MANVNGIKIVDRYNGLASELGAAASGMAERARVLLEAGSFHSAAHMLTIAGHLDDASDAIEQGKDAERELRWLAGLYLLRIGSGWNLLLATIQDELNEHEN